MEQFSVSSLRALKMFMRLRGIRYNWKIQEHLYQLHMHRQYSSHRLHFDLVN